MKKYILILILVLATVSNSWAETQTQLAPTSQSDSKLVLDQILTKLQKKFQTSFKQPVKIQKKVSSQKKILMHSFIASYNPQSQKDLGFTFDGKTQLATFREEFSKIFQMFKTDISVFKKAVKAVTEVRFSRKKDGSTDQFAKKYRLDFTIPFGQTKYAYVFIDSNQNIKMIEFLDSRGTMQYDFRAPQQVSFSQ